MTNQQLLIKRQHQSNRKMQNNIHFLVFAIAQINSSTFEFEIDHFSLL
jgi:hypothetical protein